MKRMERERGEEGKKGGERCEEFKRGRGILEEQLLHVSFPCCSRALILGVSRGLHGHGYVGTYGEMSFHSKCVICPFVNIVHTILRIRDTTFQKS